MANTVSHHDEELARFYGVMIRETNKGFVVPEFEAICRFTGNRIRAGTIEFVIYEIKRHQIPSKSY